MVLTATLPLAELAHGPATVTAGDLVIAVLKVGDRYYAIDNKCPHRGAPLSKGLQDAADIICPLHHFRFSLESGACHLPRHLRVRTFPVRVEGEMLVVEVPAAK